MKEKQREVRDSQSLSACDDGEHELRGLIQKVDGARGVNPMLLPDARKINDARFHAPKTLQGVGTKDSLGWSSYLTPLRAIGGGKLARVLIITMGKKWELAKLEVGSGSGDKIINMAWGPWVVLPNMARLKTEVSNLN